MSANPFSAVRQYFTKWREQEFLRNASNEEIFTRIYLTNKWGDANTRSGKGSSLARTVRLRRKLPHLIKAFNISSLLDIPCGDFYWMEEIELGLELYIGADIVDSLIATNNERFSNQRRKFTNLNLLRDDLPTSDALLCRDCLVHFSFADISQAISNIQQSQCRLLLTTTFPDRELNTEILTGKHRPLNFEKTPFNWPKPITQIVESECDRRGRKVLALWRIADLP